MTLCLDTSQAGERGLSSTSLAASIAVANWSQLLSLSAGTLGKLCGSDLAMNAAMSSHKLALHKAIHACYMPLATNPKNHATECMLNLVM